MWHADFHFNEVSAAGLCMQRQFDALDSYFVMIRALLPMAQANARQVYDCAGAVYPLVHYPLKADTIIHSHMHDCIEHAETQTESRKNLRAFLTVLERYVA